MVFIGYQLEIWADIFDMKGGILKNGWYSSFIELFFLVDLYGIEVFRNI